MDNNVKEEERLGKRRPFILSLDETRVEQVIKTYEKASTFLFRRPTKLKKRRFI